MVQAYPQYRHSRHDRACSWTEHADGCEPSTRAVSLARLSFANAKSFFIAGLFCLFLSFILAPTTAFAQFVCGGSATGAAPQDAQGATTGGGTGTVACGSNANAGGASNNITNATAVGDHSVASNVQSTAIGQGSTASGNSSTVVGQGSTASGDEAVVIGQGSNAPAQGATVIGQGSQATAQGATVIGQGSTANGTNSITIGNDRPHQWHRH